MPFKFHLKFSCPFQESFRFSSLKWTCGLQGNQTTCLHHITQQHVLASSGAAAQRITQHQGSEGTSKDQGPLLSRTHAAVLTAVRTLCYRTDVTLEQRPATSGDGESYVSPCCRPPASQLDIITPPLLIVSIINT